MLIDALFSRYLSRTWVADDNQLTLADFETYILVGWFLI